MREIDPIALGQAGLQALALAGTAILARYAHAEHGPDGMTEFEGTLPQADWTILMRALGAFADPGEQGQPRDLDAQRRHAVALAAMCLRARTVLAREHRSAPRGDAGAEARRGRTFQRA